MKRIAIIIALACCGCNREPSRGEDYDRSAGAYSRGWDDALRMRDRANKEGGRNDFHGYKWDGRSGFDTLGNPPDFPCPDGPPVGEASGRSATKWKGDRDGE